MYRYTVGMQVPFLRMQSWLNFHFMGQIFQNMAALYLCIRLMQLPLDWA